MLSKIETYGVQSREDANRLKIPAVTAQRFEETRDRRGCGVTAVACGVVLAALELSDVPEVTAFLALS